ncbi:hypothetical protein KR222_004180, partial [Zaprionus bogoriensis]
HRPLQSIASVRSVKELHIFPKALPQLNVGPVYDDSGFTLNERLAMRQAWRVIKPFERRYGKDFYFTFLMEHYKTFDNFRNYGGKLDLHRLHGHSLAFMRFISNVIDQNDPVMFHVMLSENYNMHNRCHVQPEHMQLLMEALISYVLDKLKDVSSASLESGFQRLLGKFQAFYEPQANRGISFISRPSLSFD